MSLERPDPDTREKLRALAQGELPAAEAVAWQQRMARSPELAAAYAQLLSDDSPSLAQLAAASRVPPRERSPLAKSIDALIAVAAVIVVVVSLTTYWHHVRTLRSFSAGKLRVGLTGPAALTEGVAANFTAWTTTVEGSDVPARVQLTLRDSAGRELASRQATSAGGLSQLSFSALTALPPSVGLELAAEYEGTVKKASWLLPVQTARPVAALTADHVRIRRGAPLRFRGMVRGLFASAARGPWPFVCRWIGAESPSDPFALRGTTRDGALAGAFDAPNGDGRLTLDSSDESFSQFALPITVLAEWPSVAYAFSHSDYAPGDLVRLSIAPMRFRASQEMRATVRAGQRPLLTKSASGGTLELEFALPNAAPTEAGKQAASEAAPKAGEDATDKPILSPAANAPAMGPIGAVTVHVQIGGDAARATDIPVPLRVLPLRVEFFPEGGQLAPWLPNKVYLRATDAHGRPIQLSGVVVNDLDEEIVAVETGWNGLGSFPLLPEEQRAYRLRIVQPPHVHQQPALPPVRDVQRIAMTTGVGVFPPGKSIEFNLRANESGIPLLATFRRGNVQVGQTAIVTAGDGDGVNRAVVPLIDDLGGVLRMVIYDCRTTPPQIAAERLVYQHPARQLTIRCAALETEAAVAAGGHARWELSVVDERGAPADAQLQIAVVTASSLPNSDEPPPRSLAEELRYFELGDECAKLAGLPAGMDTDVALDLLLAAQPLASSSLPSDSATASDGPAKPGEAEAPADDATPRARPDRAAAPLAKADRPLIYDNLPRIAPPFQESLAEYQAGPERQVRAVISLCFCIALGLVVLVAIAGLLRIIVGVYLWLPVLGACVGCVIVGSVLMSPDQLDHAAGAVAFTTSRGAGDGNEAATTSSTNTTPTGAFESDIPQEPEPAPPQPVQDKLETANLAASFAYRQGADGQVGSQDGLGEAGDTTAPRTLFWTSNLPTREGRATIEFDVPPDAAAVRVVIDAFSPERSGWLKAHRLLEPPPVDAAGASGEPAQDAVD